MQFIEGTSFHASLGRTGMKKWASFEIFVRQIRTTVRKWELWTEPFLKLMYEGFDNSKNTKLHV